MVINIDNKSANIVKIYTANPKSDTVQHINTDCPSNYGLYNSNCEAGNCIQCWENALEIAKQ